MGRGKVSCIIPVYNSEEYIEQVVNSALDQCDEVIIVNDKTPDNSMEVLEKFKDKIRIFELKENQGCGYAKNFGADKAKYKYLLFMDGDQVLGKDWVKKAKRGLEGDIVCVGGVRPNPKETFSQKLMHVLLMKNKYDKYPDMIDGVIMTTRKTFEECGPFFQELKRGGVQKFMKGIHENGYKCKRLDIKSMHLGEPKTFSGLLKRQWKYGKEELAISKKVSLRKIFEMIIFFRLFGLLGSITLYRFIVFD